MRGKRGVGEKRSVRRSIQITNDMERKLNRLSVSTGLPVATIISIFLEQCLESADHINWLQDIYCRNDQFRAYCYIEDGKIILV